MESVVKIEIRSLAGRKLPMALTLNSELANEYAILRSFDYQQLYEPEVCHLLTHALAPGDVFIDVGANAGFFTVMAALLVGKRGHVLAFEPGDNTLKRLENNIALNELTNVTIIPKPATAVVEEVDFYLNDSNSGGNSVWNPKNFIGNAHSTQQRRRMQSTTIDVELSQRDLNPPKIIKIDTEGAEHAVLRGARQMLHKEAVPFIIAELHEFGLEQLGSSQTDFRNYMSALQYDTFIPYPDGSLPKLIPLKTRVSSGVFMNLLFSSLGDVEKVWTQETFDPAMLIPPRSALRQGV